ncbi:MAG: hypothetical protein ACYS0G_03875 [Planctomycetota bacterium]|jgi:hypothetical protein
MSSKEGKDSYDLEPPEPEPSLEPEAIPGAEPEALSEEPSSIKALDVCPNCGSPLGGVEAVVCLRCGFNLKTLEVVETATGEAAAAEEMDAESEPPLSAPGAGDVWLPGIIAIASLLVLSIGYLAGWGGLFAGDEAVGVGGRLVGLLKMSVKTVVFTVSGLGALHILAHMLSSRLGDIKLAAVRMVGIVAAIGLLAFFQAGSVALEWTIEIILQAAAFVALAMALFRLSVRDAVTLLGVTVIAVVGLLLASAVVLWAVPPVG